MKIGIIIEDLSASHLSYCLIKKLNETVSKDSTNDYTIFVENITSHVLPPRFAVMNTTELPYFDGTLIATSISTCLTAIKSISPSKKICYVWDLEWMRNTGRNYEHSIQAFIDKSVVLVARSESHAKAIKNYCNKTPSCIAEDFNIEKMMEVINNAVC